MNVHVPFLEVRIAAEVSGFQEGFHDKEPDKVHYFHIIQFYDHINSSSGITPHNA